MTLFSLSLDGKARNWYDNFLNNSFTTIADFKSAFLEKFGNKKEPRHLAATLIYKPTKIFRRKNQITEKVKKMVDNARV